MKNWAIMLRILILLFILQANTACEKIEKMYESRNDDQLAKAKVWPAVLLAQIGVKCNLRTSWREGKMYYIFDAEPLMNAKEAMETENKPEGFVRSALESRSLARSLEYGIGMPELTVKLNDKGGFQILSLEMVQTVRIVDKDGMPVRLQQKSSVEYSRKTYEDIAGWTVQWRR